MTWTSFAALARLSVPTVTVLKNLTNLFVIVGAPHCPSLQGSCEKRAFCSSANSQGAACINKICSDTF